MRDSGMARDRRAGFSLLEMIIVVVVTLVVAAIGIPKFLTLVNVYRINDSARRLQSIATLAHVKAAARNTRYQVSVVSGSTTSYVLKYCQGNVLLTSGCTTCCATWVTDATSATQILNGGVTFSTGSLTTAPPVASSVAQASEMTFNSRGLLFDESANAPADNRCWYLAGTNAKPMAVCTILTGRTLVYQYNGVDWLQL